MPVLQGCFKTTDMRSISVGSGDVAKVSYVLLQVQHVQVKHLAELSTFLKLIIAQLLSAKLGVLMTQDIFKHICCQRACHVHEPIGPKQCWQELENNLVL